MVTRQPEQVSIYTAPHVLLPFIRRFMQEKSSYSFDAVELVRDGSMRFRLRYGENKLRILWTEHERGTSGELSFKAGFVSLEQRRKKPGRAEDQQTLHAIRHVARRIERLLTGHTPHLLLWRNRNPQRITWGTRMFENLCPGLLVRQQTHYYDYIVSRVDEYEGYINVEFQSRSASVILRITLEDHRHAKQLISWGPISLVVLEDRRTPAQCRSQKHKVEEFLGYILSRNLPPRFTLKFEFDDPPAGYRPPDSFVDFLATRRLDDTSFFEMLFNTPASIGVVTSCDRECFNLFSLVAAPKENWTTTTPWQSVPARNYLHHCYNVNMDTCSTIMGDDLLDRCLDRLNNSPYPPEFIILFDSCLHRLIGVDFQQTIKHFRQSSSIPVVYYDIRTSQHPYLQQMKEFWKDVFLQAADTGRVPRSGRVSFLGLHPYVEQEMAHLLQALGIESGALLFPHLPLGELKDICSSSLIVVNDWEYVRIIFSDMLAALDRQHLRLNLPYGVEGTRRWLARITKMVERDPDAVDSLDDIDRAHENLGMETRSLAGARMGIFLRARGASVQLSSNLRFGVPLVAFIHELGMGLDVNLFVDQDESPPEPESLRAVGIDTRSGDSVGFFSHFRELPDRLKSSDFEFVYTETFRDERITAAGKIPVKLHVLLPGLRGAVKTARTLRGLLQSGFYRRYNRHLSSLYLREPFVPGSDQHGPHR